MQPDFSVIVPTRNRPQKLRTLLTALCAIDYPTDRFEVIIVWDGVDRSSESVVDLFRERLHVRSLQVSHRGPGPARQAAIDQAKGEYIAFVDDDCEPALDWLQGFARGLRTDAETAIGGKVVNKLTRNAFASTNQLLIDHVYSLYNADPDRASFFTTNNAAVSAAALRRMGGFDREWSITGAEDRDFWMRWQQAGLRMRYDSRIIVEHAHAMNWRSFLQTHYRYGQGALHFHKRYPSSRSASLRFFRGLPMFFLGRAHFPRSLIYLVLVCMSQMASAAGLFGEWLRQRSEGAPQPTARGGSRPGQFEEKYHD